MVDPVPISETLEWSENTCWMGDQSITGILRAACFYVMPIRRRHSSCSGIFFIWGQTSRPFIGHEEGGDIHHQVGQFLLRQGMPLCLSFPQERPVVLRIDWPHFSLGKIVGCALGMKENTLQVHLHGGQSTRLHSWVIWSWVTTQV